MTVRRPHARACASVGNQRSIVLPLHRAARVGGDRLAVARDRQPRPERDHGRIDRDDARARSGRRSQCARGSRSRSSVTVSVAPLVGPRATRRGGCSSGGGRVGASPRRSPSCALGRAAPEPRSTAIRAAFSPCCRRSARDERAARSAAAAASAAVARPRLRGELVAARRRGCARRSASAAQPRPGRTRLFDDPAVLAGRAAEAVEAGAAPRRATRRRARSRADPSCRAAGRARGRAPRAGPRRRAARSARRRAACDGRHARARRPPAARRRARPRARALPSPASSA